MRKQRPQLRRRLTHPCTQHKAKECHKPDSISVSRTAPSTPSHRRYVSDRAKYQRGGAGGRQSSDSRSFTTSPRRQAASEAILDSSSPARTAAFAAARYGIGPECCGPPSAGNVSLRGRCLRTTRCSQECRLRDSVSVFEMVTI